MRNGYWVTKLDFNWISLSQTTGQASVKDHENQTISAEDKMSLVTAYPNSVNSSLFVDLGSPNTNSVAIVGCYFNSVIRAFLVSDNSLDNINHFPKRR